MSGKPEKCRGCPLFAVAKGPVWGCGPAKARLVFLGEAPGPDEVRRGQPFVGRAGAVFDIGLKAAGIDRREVYVTNVVKCMPPQGDGFRKPTHLEVQACRERWLREELKGVEPNVVVAMGETALDALVDRRGYGVMEWRGYVEEVEL